MVRSLHSAWVARSTLGLEYEMNSEGAWTAYMEIRKAIEKKAQLDTFLSVTTNSDIQEFLKQCFGQTKPARLHLS
jgi:hypothetical protein